MGKSLQGYILVSKTHFGKIPWYIKHFSSSSIDIVEDQKSVAQFQI